MLILTSLIHAVLCQLVVWKLMYALRKSLSLNLSHAFLDCLQCFSGLITWLQNLTKRVKCSLTF